MKEMVEPASIHAFYITVLIAPGKGLLADDSVHTGQFWYIRIIDKLAILWTNTEKLAIFFVQMQKPYPCDSGSEDSQLQGVSYQKNELWGWYSEQLDFG